MKLYKIKRILFLFTIGILAFAVSCDTTEETFSEFTEGGEKILIGKPVSVVIAPGDLKARFDVTISADPKIKRGTVTWITKIGTDASHEFDVVRTTTGSEIIEVLIDGIEEGSREYTVTLLGDSGRTSLPSEVSGPVFGPVYQSNIQPLTRPLASDIVTKVDGTAEITFEDATAGLYKTILRYEDADGVSQDFELDSDTNVAILDSFNGDVQLEIFSIFKPTENAIDTFASTSRLFDFPKVVLPTDKALWTQVSLNNDIVAVKPVWAPVSVLAGVWDGNPGTYGGYIPPHDLGPHFTVSLGLDSPKALEELWLGAWGGQGGEAVKDYEVWGIADITDADTTVDFLADPDGWRTEMESKGWVRILETQKPANVDHAVKVTDPTKVNFIRFVALTRFDGNTTDLRGWGDLDIKVFL